MASIPAPFELKPPCADCQEDWAQWYAKFRFSADAPWGNDYSCGRQVDYDWYYVK